MKNLGIMTAVISPMLADGVTVNEKALTAILEDQISKGAGSLLLLGGTGENTAVPKAARTKILELAVKVIDHRVPVIAGVVELGVYEAIESAKAAKAAGADMILVAPPFGRATTVQGCVDYFKVIDDAVDMPILIYNFPGRFGDNGYGTNPDTVGALIEAVPNVIGIKEASGDIGQMQRILDNRPEGFLVLSGDDGMAIELMRRGGDGVISVAANAFPQRFMECVNHAKAGDFDAAEKAYAALDEAVHALFEEGNPVGVKCALSVMGRIGDTMRLPLVAGSGKLRAKFEELIARYDLR